MAIVVAENCDELHGLLSDALEDVLRDQVGPVIEGKLLTSIGNRVVDSQSLWTRELDGIDDQNNIVGQVSISNKGTRHTELTLEVKDIAKPQKPRWGTFNTSIDDAAGGTIFSQWIENGEWMDWAAFAASNYTVKQKRPARPFVSPVQQSLNKNPMQVIRIIKKNFKT